MKVQIGYGPDIYGMVEAGGADLTYSGSKADSLRRLLEPMLASSKTSPAAFLETLPTKLNGRTWAKIVGDSSQEGYDPDAEALYGKSINIKLNKEAYRAMLRGWKDYHE